MAFFQDLGKKIGEVAQDAQKKTSELIEVNKLNSAIKDEKDAIAELHRKIGMTMYARFAAGDPVPESVAPDAEAIAGKLRNIMSLEAKIVEIKSDEAKPAVEAKPVTETVNPSESHREASEAQPAGQAPETSSAPQDTPAPASGPRFCTSCGALLVPGVAFCGKCGQRVG